MIGPYGTYASEQSGAGAIPNPTYTVTPLEGIRQRAPAGVNVQYARGTDPPSAADMLPGPEQIPSSVFSPPGSAGETGVRAVQYIQGDAVWKAGDEGKEVVQPPERGRKFVEADGAGVCKPQVRRGP